jgi:hypothetical protein
MPEQHNPSFPSGHHLKEQKLKGEGKGPKRRWMDNHLIDIYTN